MFNKLVKDSQTVSDALKEVELNPQEQTAKELLTVVTAQDIEEKEDGKVVLKKGVAKDRVISVEDPEMRHGHKTSRGKLFTSAVVNIKRIFKLAKGEVCLLSN